MGLFEWSCKICNAKITLDALDKSDSDLALDFCERCEPISANFIALTKKADKLEKELESIKNSALEVLVKTPIHGRDSSTIIVQRELLAALYDKCKLKTETHEELFDDVFKFWKYDGDAYQVIFEVLTLFKKLNGCDPCKNKEQVLEKLRKQVIVYLETMKWIDVIEKIQTTEEVMKELKEC